MAWKGDAGASENLTRSTTWRWTTKTLMNADCRAAGRGSSTFGGRVRVRRSVRGGRVCRRRRRHCVALAAVIVTVAVAPSSPPVVLAVAVVTFSTTVASSLSLVAAAAAAAA
eukprot:CAMPEP_0171851536 /NCGR_PEP_ID=MMETSP0992-20121227/21082_1 /TAXON_ID=483369 /ORGANISM="non described non described, Strain CCMP2098" /LENGTH=111 /DNA_ID=CAMNT_0012471459 /DNA_START=378 /DNA_END=711 /DNA_ORIENTATION=+